MLSDLNRVKNMRIANQNLSDVPKSQLTQRRENAATANNEDKNRKLALLGQSTQNRPSLLIQTMPSIQALKNAANHGSAVKTSKQDSTNTSKRLNMNHQDASLSIMSGILASSSDLPTKIISPAQSRADCAQTGSPVSAAIKGQREKSVTRLAHNGLRIIQTNNLVERHNATQ